MPPTHVATAWGNLKTPLKCLWISRGFHSQVFSASRLGFLSSVPYSMWVWNLYVLPVSLQQNNVKHYATPTGHLRSYRTKDHRKGWVELFIANNSKIHIWHFWLRRSFLLPCTKTVPFFLSFFHPQSPVSPPSLLFFMLAMLPHSK